MEGHTEQEEGEERELRWKRPVVGLAQRTARSLDAPSNFRAAELCIRPLSLGPLYVSAEEVRALLSCPLGALCDTFVRTLECSANVPEVLPFDEGVWTSSIDQHPDIDQSVLAMRSLERLRNDMRTFARMRNSTPRTVLALSSPGIV